VYQVGKENKVLNLLFLMELK